MQLFYCALLSKQLDVANISHAIGRLITTVVYKIKNTVELR